MSDQDIKSLDEKKREIEARIETMDDPTLGTQDHADELRDELEELEKHTPESYRLTEEIFALRDDLERIDKQLGMMDGSGVVPHADDEDVENLRDRRTEIAEEIKSKQSELSDEAGKAVTDASAPTATERMGQ